MSGPSPEYAASPPDPLGFTGPELRRRIHDVWIPQIVEKYGPDFVPIEAPDREYLDRRSGLAADLADIHRRYAEGLISGHRFIGDVYDFRSRRDALDVHHYQFDAAIWEAGVLEGAEVDADRDQFTYDGRGPARRRLAAIENAFPELR